MSLKTPGSSKAGGEIIGFPDACKTPMPPAGQVPLPYPTIAMVANATDTIDVVLIEKKETVVLGSKVPRCSGNEPGVGGGVVSNKNMGEVHPKEGSSKVYAKGKKMVFMLTKFGMNANGKNANSTGFQATPSQTKVLISM